MPKIKKQGLVAKVLSDLSEENCLFAVKQDWNNITFIPKPSVDVLKVAIEKGGLNVMPLIDEELITKELWIELIDKDRYGSLLKKMPVEYQTDKNCLDSVNRNGYLLEFVVNKSPEICAAALKQNCNAFRFIPEELRTSELYGKSIKNGVIKIEDVPKDKLNKDVYVQFVSSNAPNIKLVPDEFKTAEFYAECIKVNSYCFKYIPKEFMTNQMCLDTLERDSNMIEFIPKELQTEEVCLKFLSKLRYYPRDMVKFILTDSEVIKKKLNKMKKREKMYQQQMGMYFHGEPRGFFCGGHGYDDDFDDDDFDDMGEVIEKLDSLTSEVKSLKEKIVKLENLNKFPTEIPTENKE